MAARLTALLLCLAVLAFAFTSQAAPVVDRIDHPEQPCDLAEDADMLEIVFPAVRSADCAILRCQGQVMLIDGATADQARDIVLPALHAMGITKIDFALNSHPHEDHLNGLGVIGSEIPIGILYFAFDPEENYNAKNTLRTLTEHGTRIIPVTPADTLYLGNARMDLFQYGRKQVSYNDRSVCTKVTLGDAVYLTVGDIGDTAQRGILADLPPFPLKCDILKYPHHGHNAVNKDLWALMDPQLALISENTYNCPVGFKFCQRMGVQAISVRANPVRMRTDGNVWLVEPFIPEEYPVSQGADHAL